MSLLSVILPSYNEEAVVEHAATVLHELFTKEDIPYELLFVNDGSTDATWTIIKKMNAKNPQIKGIHLSRNFGKEAAILAGLREATGECAIVMDVDLQHPPETAVEMYRIWEQGYQIVEGIKASRGNEGIFYKASSKLFYRLIHRASGFDMQSSSDFKLLDRIAIEAYLQLPERQLFFRALSYWLGYHQTTVPFHVQERHDGETKWSSLKLMKYAIANVTSFSALPMQIVTLVGFLFMLFSIGLGIYSLGQFLTGNSLEGFTTVILLLLGIGSIMMMSLGIIGYYISKIYEETKRRPRYLISKRTSQENRHA